MVFIAIYHFETWTQFNPFLIDVYVLIVAVKINCLNARNPFSYQDLKFLNVLCLTVCDGQDPIRKSYSQTTCRVKGLQICWVTKSIWTQCQLCTFLPLRCRLSRLKPLNSQTQTKMELCAPASSATTQQHQLILTFISLVCHFSCRSSNWAHAIKVQSHISNSTAVFSCLHQIFSWLNINK